jgi:hypothetical protein
MLCRFIHSNLQDAGVPACLQGTRPFSSWLPGSSRQHCSSSQAQRLCQGVSYRLKAYSRPQGRDSYY